MASHKGPFLENEVSILSTMYERGLRSKTKHKELLEEAKGKTGLSTERIMQWIHSRASREKAKAQGKTYTKIFKRKPTLYSVALSDVLKRKDQGSDVKQRTKTQGEEWKKIKQNPDELQKVQLLYEKKIEEYDQKMKNPSRDERKRRDRWLIKKLEHLIEELSDNGTEVAVVMVHKTSSSCTTRGSLLGEDFLDERPDIIPSFYQKCIGSPPPILCTPLGDLRRKITALWNEKYSMAVAQPGRVPYTSIAKNDITIILHGTDILFKEPKSYRRFEMEKLLENQAGIRMQVIRNLAKECEKCCSGGVTDRSEQNQSEAPLNMVEIQEIPESDMYSKRNDSNANNEAETNMETLTEKESSVSESQELQETETHINIDGHLVEVVLEDEIEKTTEQTTSLSSDIKKGNLLISKWDDCGDYFGYVQNSYIDWSSNPIMFNKKSTIIGVNKKMKLGAKPIHRTKLENHGDIICIVPKMFYKRDKSYVYPYKGFHEYVKSTLG